jgi:hypothetical protein
MAKRIVIAITAIISAYASACGLCSNTSDCPSPQVCSADGVCVELAPNPATECFDGDATITIHVTAPDGITPAGRATILIGGQDLVTDAEGNVVVTLPKGDHQISARRDGFSGSKTIAVCGGRDIDVSIGIKPPPGRIGVVPGSFDSIEDVLRSMGFSSNVGDFVMIDENAIAQPDALFGLDYLFFNCGHFADVNDPQVQANIRDFVERGGKLYTSDWAINVVRALWPEKITGQGPFGNALEDVPGEVLYSDLAEYLGKSTVELNYNLAGWETLTSVSSDTVTMIRGNGGEVGTDPLLIQFAVGEGRVTFTTFHNEAQTTSDMDRILAFLVFTL